MKLFIYIILQFVKILFLSCIFFPILWTTSVAYDWFFSNSGYLLEIMHGSKNYYLHVLKHDWILSIPISVFVSLVVFLPVENYLYRSHGLSPIAVFIAKSVIIIIAAILLYKTFIPGIIFFISSALLLFLFYRALYQTVTMIRGKFTNVNQNLSSNHRHSLS